MIDVLVRRHLEKLYEENVNDEMYAPDVYQSKFDYKAGYKQKEKEIKDKINHLKSLLQDLVKIKLDKKAINKEKVKELETQIDILQKLL